jgi:hypothetical protein
LICFLARRVKRIYFQAAVVSGEFTKTELKRGDKCMTIITRRGAIKMGGVPNYLSGMGEKMVLMTEKMDALFVWRKFIDASGRRGVSCAIFRNESSVLSSEHVREAVAMAKER